MKLPEEQYRLVLETMPIVCVDGLIQDEHGRYLLVKRLNEPLKNEFWLPGGRLEKGERLEAAIQRKMREELSADVEIVRLLGHFEEFFERTEQGTASGMHAISFVFLLRLLSDGVVLDSQSGEWGWFDELPGTFERYGLHLREQEIS